MLRFVIIAALSLGGCSGQLTAMPLNEAKEEIVRVLDGMEFPQKDPVWCRSTALQAIEKLYEARDDDALAAYYTDIMRHNGCFDPYSRFELASKERPQTASPAVSVPSQHPPPASPPVEPVEAAAKRPMLPEAVAYVRLMSVRAEPVRLARTALENARSARYIVLDLRGDLGGDLDEAERFLALFAPKFGTLMFSTTTKRNDRERRAFFRGKYADLPVAVLVDSSTASAAEVIARVLRSWGKTIIGQPTFGKGVYQSIHVVGPLKVSVTGGYTLIGEGKTPFHGSRLAPDEGLVVEDVRIAPQPEDDESVRAALAHFGLIVR